MTHEQADEMFGPICFKTPFTVVRCKVTSSETKVYIHRLANDQEMIPGGYFLGENAATLRHS